MYVCVHVFSLSATEAIYPVERALSYRRQPAQGAGERVPGSATGLAGSGPAWFRACLVQGLPGSGPAWFRPCL
eukprot:6075792-Lingulodinium_polyedra.AAC.1